ncbi:MAG: PIG-L deacetylase family protein [Vicinamibacterales bacterium]
MSEELPIGRGVTAPPDAPLRLAERLRTAARLSRVRLLRHLAATLSDWSEACLKRSDEPRPVRRHAHSAGPTKPGWTTLLSHFDRPHVLERLFSAGLIGDDLPRAQGLPCGRRLLVLAPHQDDETIAAGGTFLLCARAGRRFEVVYYTDGATRVADMLPEEVSRWRREEARQVWRRLAGVSPTFWNYPNRAPGIAPDAGSRLAALIADFRPDTIFLPTFFEQPIEHRRLNQVLLEANAIHPIDEEVEVWGYQVTTRVPGNHAVDITRVWKKKYAINRRWRTQNAYKDYAHLAMGRDIANSYFLKGARVPRRAAAHAELFLAFPAPEYLELAATFADVRSDPAP